MDNLAFDDKWEIEEGGRRAFSNNIKEIQLPETITYIGNNSFGGTYSSYSSYSYEYVNQMVVFSNVVKINMPSNIEYIGKGAFCGCKKLKEIEIPESIREIESNVKI